MEKKDLPVLEKRLGIILIFVVLFASGIFILYYSWSLSFEESGEKAEFPEAQIKTYKPPQIPPKNLPNPERLNKAVKIADAVRSAKEYYANRAYPGAPPVIPHKNTATGNCLACHENGGYVPKMKRYAPVTPHPEFIACAQCHVRQEKTADAEKNLFRPVSPPELKNKFLVSSPAPIPHSLNMRTNCVACHGPGSPKKWQSPHPGRVNCVQCHVEQQISEVRP